MNVFLPVLALLQPQEISEQTLEAVKAATVLVKIDVGPISGSGTGFLFRAEGETGYILTNRHVVEAWLVRRVGALSVVFQSGSKNEKTAAAKIVAAESPEGAEFERLSRDLAVLRVTGVKDLPRPLDLAKESKLRETLPVYMFGFPFGDALAAGSRHPEVTITKGAISALRKDDSGTLKLVQIDGRMNPGNSGGPVVDAEGRLVGVSVAIVGGAGISFAVPPNSVQKMLAGRLGSLTVKIQEVKDGTAQVLVEQAICDPFGRFTEWAVLYAPEGAGTKVEEKNGTWSPLPGAAREPLQRNGVAASAILKIRSAENRTVPLLIQVSYKDPEGKIRCTKPVPLAIDFAKSGDEPPADEKKEPQPAPASDPRRGKPVPRTETLADLIVTDAGLDAAGAAPSLAWTADGRAFYWVNGDGLLRRMNASSFEEEARADLAGSGRSLALSSEGLVVAAADRVRILDAVTLQEKRQIPLPGVTRAVSAPSLSFVYAIARPDKLHLLDAAAGSVLKVVTADEMNREFGKTVKKHPDGRGLFAFEQIETTPDGRFLFAVCAEGLHRFAIRGKDLVYEEMGAAIARKAQAIEISPDGTLVCVPAPAGNSERRNHPAIPPNSTYVYRVDDLAKPEAFFTQGPQAVAVGLDPKGGYIYAQSRDQGLIVFDIHGTRKKEVALPGGAVRRFLVHPSGRRLLALTNSRLVRVDLPQ